RLEGLIARMTALAASIDRARRRAQALGGVRPPPDLAPTADLERSIARIATTSKRAATARARAAVLAALEHVGPPPAVADTAPLGALLGGFARLEQRIGA